MKTLLVVVALVGAGAWAKGSSKEEVCKTNCASIRGSCVKGCESEAKNKKAKVACIKQACEMAVQECERSCKGAR